jgi:hypothetical protein
MTLSRCARAALFILAAVLLLLTCAGCARRIPIADLGPSGAEVWARVVTVDGEELTGRVLSLDASSIALELRYPIEGDVRIQTRSGTRELFSGAARVPGELADVTAEENGRVALVRRSLRTPDITSATFHETRGEQSLRSVVSMLLGPALGGLAGLLF